MKKSSTHSILSGTLWGIIAKVIDALAKFVTIPMLVGHYGKGDYGLIALAFSLNAYLRLMDMGMNIGSIRFFSMWIASNEFEKIGKVSRSSIVFYGVIGLINALIFVVMAQYAGSYFKLLPEQLDVFKWMMYVLAASTVFNWTSNVISQLLSAHNELGWLNRVTVISSICNFITAFIAIKFNLSLPYYFFLYTLSTLIIIPLNVYKLKVYELSRLQLLFPEWDGKAFKEILGYSLAIFSMGIFQFSADNLRPLLLGKYASKGIEVLTEYRVIQTIATLIIAFGGVFMDVLLPSASKIYAENDTAKIDNMVYNGTKYVTVFLAFIVFLLITDAKTILTLYMGKSYDGLTIWLILWLLTVLIYMHIVPITSLVLSSGKTKFLVYSSATACILSLPITALLAPWFNVGAAVVGYFIYIILQIGGYYFYYMPKVLNLNSARLFLRSFFPAASAGAIAFGTTYFVTQFVHFQNRVAILLFNSGTFLSVFAILTLIYVINPSEIRELKRKIFPA